jgi:hypothetical protein
MHPEEDVRAILRLDLRHEPSVAVSLDPSIARRNLRFSAQQCVENLVKGLIVLPEEQSRFIYDLAHRQREVLLEAAEGDVAPVPPTAGGAGGAAGRHGKFALLATRRQPATPRN